MSHLGDGDAPRVILDGLVVSLSTIFARLAAMEFAIERSQAGGHSRVVLAVISAATDDAGVSVQAIDDIARKARISRRTAQRCIEALEQLGELQVQRASGASSRYRVLVHAADQERQRQALALSTPRPEPASSLGLEI